jgi:L,D-transpeptidase catalytic domain
MSLYLDLTNMYNSVSIGIEKMRIKIKQKISFLIVLALALSVLPTPNLIAFASPSPENNSGAVLCPPAAYLQTPDDCAPLGPSQYLTDMAQQGMELPLHPLQISHPDPSLGDLPYHYYKVNNTGTAFYPDLQSAMNQTGGQALGPGAFMYVVYSQQIPSPKGTYFLLPSGAVMPGDGSRVSVSTPFPGVEVHATPRNPFGWAYNPTPIRREPNEMGYNIPTGKLNLDDIVQIYDSQNIEGTVWDLIGPDEWVLGRDIAEVVPNTTPPNGVTNGRWIDVNLAEQTLAVYDNSQLIYATVVATGADPLFTRPGLFPIYKKLELEKMTGDRNTPDFYYLENVPWTMYFDQARALHGAYWRARLGFPQSHGCVNLSPGDAHWLFNWAKVGDWVYVHDPTGLTPTDPSFYGDGGGA